MITIGKIPKKVQSFFRSTRNTLSAHVYTYYCNLVMAICISHGSTIQRLVNLLRNSTHRTNHGEFLWRSDFDEMTVIAKQAIFMLKSLYKKGCKQCMRIIDDTQTIKRAKKCRLSEKYIITPAGNIETDTPLLKPVLSIEMLQYLSAVGSMLKKSMLKNSRYHLKNLPSWQAGLFLMLTFPTSSMFKRMRFRGIEKAAIQNLMIATIQNLRKLIKANTLKPAVSMANSALHETTYAILSRLSRYRTALITNLSEYSIFKELFQLFHFKLLFL